MGLELKLLTGSLHPLWSEIACFCLVAREIVFLNRPIFVHILVHSDPALIPGDNKKSFPVFQVFHWIDHVLRLFQMPHVVRHSFMSRLACSVRVEDMMGVLGKVIVICGHPQIGL